MFPWEEVSTVFLKQHDQSQVKMHPWQAEAGYGLWDSLRGCCKSSGYDFVVVLQVEAQSKMGIWDPFSLLFKISWFFTLRTQKLFLENEGRNPALWTINYEMSLFFLHLTLTQLWIFGDFRVSISKMGVFFPSRLKFELVCLFSLPV